MKKAILFIATLVLILTPAFSQKFEFGSVPRTNGSAFFAISKATGQLSFMLDHGQSAAKWKKYGAVIRNAGDANLSFYVQARPDGSAFFALDGATGQFYFMLDYGSNAGKWRNYGSPVPKKGDGLLVLSGEGRKDGNAFFALDSNTGQLYFMLDYGSSAGTWKVYGDFALE
jgi:hypothetical protein